MSGELPKGKHPWGAHYLPLPSHEAVHVRDLLQELGVIRGYRDGDPIYGAEHLCHDPHERLLEDGLWHEGLIPRLDGDMEASRQLEAFERRIHQLRQARGSDGLRAFAIPLDVSSTDEEFRALDGISFSSWLDREGFTHPSLRWHADYCCRDDYGAGAERVSAWAGLHYFASRGNGRQVPDKYETVLTWPEGNGFLVRGLSRGIEKTIQTGQLVHNVAPFQDGVRVSTLDIKGGGLEISAQRAIFAGPRFVACRVVNGLAVHLGPSPLEYTPWVVANITLSRLPTGPGFPLAWDNVSRGSRSLGYVVANHQNLCGARQSGIVTWYKPLDHLSPSKAREEAHSKNHKDWVSEVLEDLERSHPGISGDVQSIDVWVWGHAMPLPAPGFIWGEARRSMLKPFGTVHFAHSDMSGISIFEEAQFRGVEAAKAVLESLRA